MRVLELTCITQIIGETCEDVTQYSRAKIMQQRVCMSHHMCGCAWVCDAVSLRWHAGPAWHQVFAGMLIKLHGNNNTLLHGCGLELTNLCVLRT